MRWLSLWLCVILTGLHALAQETLADDPRLQTRITVWLKMEPLRETLRTISKQTGVPLRCQDAIQHYKVSVFVEDRPAGEILTQLASLFRYAWRKDGEAYVLYVPDETRQQEESVLRAAREARVRALRDVIRFAREAIKNPPAEAEDDDSYWNPPQPSEDAPPEEWNRWLAYRCRPWEATREYAQKRGNFPEWIFEDAVLLALLAKMPPQAERALLNGQLVGFSTRPAPGIYPMPMEMIAPFYIREQKWDEEAGRYRTAQQNPEYWGFWIRLPERGNYLEYELVGFMRDQSLPENRRPSEARLHRSSHLFVFHTSPYVRDHPWLAQWRAWATPQKEWEKRIPERALTERHDRAKPQFPSYVLDRDYSNNLVNSADLLEWFAWSTRLPVISESFRTDSAWVRELNLSAPRNVLRELSEGAWVRVNESGYVLRRVELYWAWRLVELPEDWLRPLEQRFAQKRWLDLDDYITLAARLTERQASYYEALNSGYVIYDRLNPAIRFPFVTVIHNLRGLRFLAALSASQRQRLLRGEWIPTETLTLPQRQRFEEALGERFPPPERLMVINFPYRFIDDARMQALGSAPQTSTADLPPVERAAFRLEFAPEKPLRYEIRRPSGATAYLSPSDVRIQIPDSGDLPPDFAEEIRTTLRRPFAELLLKWLNEEPGSQLYLARTQGYTLELQAPPARRKTYYIFQRRAEPVDVRTLEAKLKELEKPSDDTQAQKP
jgi:hypothetical protein